MAEIRAFRAYRYDLGQVGALSNVVAPPYDVIDPVLQQALYDRSPYNVIRLILNREEPSDTDNHNRYTRAAGFLRDWQQNRLLAQDSARSLYVYHQAFEAEGTRYTRRGFLARVRLERFGEGKVYPHEETMPGPKADRLRLFHATAMNLSPIFAVYPDESGAVQARLEEAVRRSLPLEATDNLGVVNRLWAVSDQRAVSAVTGLMGPKPLFIADGHHRYETALRYLEECRAAGEASDPEAAPNFVLMMLVSMSDPGLVILPTHRLVSGIPPVSAERLRTLLAPHFEVETIGGGEKAAQDAWELIQADSGQEMLAFGTAADGMWHTARFRSPQLMTELVPQHSQAWRSLAVSVFQVLVLGQMLPQGIGGQPVCRYVHLVREAVDAIANKECQLAALVPPATMQHVEQIAGNLEKMPAKSTYFYPKLLSGLVLNPLKGS